MKILKNKLVAVAYDLSVGDDDDREMMESATKEQPLRFIYGIGAMLPAFEDNIKLLEAGDKFEFSLTPENAYGERIEENVIELPKKVFEVDGKFDTEYVKEGATLPMMSSSGERMNGSVLEVNDDVVLMDFNHPLAGETLFFSGEILDVHDPTDEEILAINKEMGGCSCHNCDDSCCDDGCCDNSDGNCCC
ncbi:MAG: FKBP-type peptidyl-prolyl cis-trans isomerase [Tannerella sp.]|jgi:FKBP-type peptidyl-prolyl cis-trans isomerase SlyD|nr:FKBP-type peptidyl-prolyl cis-trans isomerase [Tannerella sp.]